MQRVRLDSDQIRSSRVITDSVGTVVYTAQYDPFGGIISETNNGYAPHLKFSGKEREKESGLDYFGARYYDNISSRFISVDPVINKDEALVNPQLWNLYSYCRNNPVSFFDPDGRDIYGSVWNQLVQMEQCFDKETFDNYLNSSIQAYSTTLLNLWTLGGYSYFSGGAYLGAATQLARGGQLILASSKVAAVERILIAIGLAGVNAKTISNVSEMSKLKDQGNINSTRGRYGDKKFGIKDKDFWKWWERVGKQGGPDLQNAKEANGMYKYWQDIGSPIVKK